MKLQIPTDVPLDSLIFNEQSLCANASYAERSGGTIDISQVLEIYLAVVYLFTKSLNIRHS